MRNLVKSGALALGLVAGGAQAEGCLDVTLTGTQGGPPVFNGLNGAGTLVRYGSEESNCGDVILQFDAGRGTLQALSQVGVPAPRVQAIFLTHIHSDHVDGLADLMQVRWHFASAGPKVDLVCNGDVAVQGRARAMSCANLAAHIGDAYIASGEMEQRLAENPKRLPGGPADLFNLALFEGPSEPTEVWSKGDVRVMAVASRHVPGHASYRVDTPAGSVVIGGDAGNDRPAPPRDSSTSANVETLAQGADILVHSTIHPVMGPDLDSGFPPPIYFRQSTAKDLGSLAQRAGVATLIYTHLIPPLGAARQGPYQIPGGALSKADYDTSARQGGFEGVVVVGTDGASVRLPAN